LKNSKLYFIATIICMLFAVSFAAGDEFIKKYSRQGSKPKLYYPGIMVGKTYFVAGTGDGTPENSKEDYYTKTIRCISGIQRSLKLADIDLQNIVHTWVMLEDITGMKDMARAWNETFPENPPTRTTIGVANIPGDSQMEITAIAYGDLSERKIIGSEDLAYSLGVRIGTTVYFSGIGSSKPDGSQHDTFEKQSRQAMKNTESALYEAGLGFEHVVWCNIYLDRYENLEIFDNVYSEFVESGNEPARITIFVEEIPDGSHVEITCVATTDIQLRKIVRLQGMNYDSNAMETIASPGVWAGNILYLSGQYGTLHSEGITAADLETQVLQMMQNHKQVLDAAGLGFEDIVSGNVYLRNIDDYGHMNEIYQDYFIANGPGVRTCFQPNHGWTNDTAKVFSSFIMAGNRND